MNQPSNVTQAAVQGADGQNRAPADAAPYAVAPAVDIVESDVGITLLADMPGVSKSDLQVHVDGENLTIEGRARIDVPERIALLHREVRSPTFRRAFTLSRDLDPQKIEATLRDGVLHLHIPKSEAARPKRIEVRVE